LKSNINISPTISPDILKTVSSSTPIKGFGSQATDLAKEKLLSTPRGKITQLQIEQTVLKLKIEEAGVKYSIKVKQINFNKKQYPSEVEFQEALAVAEVAYKDEVASFELQIRQKDELIQIIRDNPYDKLKKEELKIKNKTKALKQKLKKLNIKAKKDLIKQVATNAAKTLTPIIALQLANVFVVLISQRKKLEELVEQINLYIDTQVKDESTVTIATNLRNNAISLINNSVDKLNKIKETIDKINRIVTIFNAIVAAINLAIVLLPPLTLPAIIKTAIDIINKASALTVSLNVLLTIATNLLGNEINNLIELRDSLKAINLKLDEKISNDLNDEQFTALSDAFLPVGSGDYEEYKGFKFAIKEEQNNPQFIVKGNKRKYAVAADRDGVEVLKSEYSFTQDPSDLIEQLKLIIDQQNLQG
jgi:hypothetical protein